MAEMLKYEDFVPTPFERRAHYDARQIAPPDVCCNPERYLVALKMAGYTIVKDD